MRCELCGQPADTHHIVSRGAGGPDVPWNTLRLCWYHHGQFHHYGWRRFCDYYPRLAPKIVLARELAGKHLEARI